MSAGKMENLFHGFCAISGSPIADVPQKMYEVTLPTVKGGVVNGVTRHCCWPCVCDTTEIVRVDTKTIQTADGPKSFHFLVIGDPCTKPEKLQERFTDSFTGLQTSLEQDAPELKCVNGKLVNATYSDHGHPIIGMLFHVKPTEQPQRSEGQNVF
jgi:hypothetical protein